LIKPKKSLGQNFLQDKNIINKIISLTNIKNENIVEIGPGKGALTDQIIIKKPKKLILIEKDNKLCSFLQNKYMNNNLLIINEDVLKYKFKNLLNYKIIANLPYNISSKFLMKNLIHNKNINEIICMIQSELADKFNYKKGKLNKYNFISEYCSNYRLNFNVSSNVFYPKPKIKSKVVTFKFKNIDKETEKLEYFIKFFFINKRKKIKSNKYFSKFINIKFLDYRYEDLDYENVLEIYKSFKFSIF